MGHSVYNRFLSTAVFSMHGLSALYSTRHRVSEGGKALRITTVIVTLEIRAQNVDFAVSRML
jgi:hypothetical protein